MFLANTQGYLGDILGRDSYLLYFLGNEMNFNTSYKKKPSQLFVIIEKDNFIEQNVVVSFYQEPDN